MFATGVDIIEISRIRDVLDAYPSRFIKRIFTDGEIVYCRGRAPNLAGRFAAKEAFVKAIGEGFRNNINFIDIDISNDKKGKPSINISNNIKKFLKKKLKLNKYKIFLSLSDEKKHSIAYVIINKQT